MSATGSPNIAKLTKLGPGRYRIGDHVLVRETARIWRDWWLPEADEGKVRAGVPGDGFATLREALEAVEHELALQNARGLEEGC